MNARTSIVNSTHRELGADAAIRRRRRRVKGEEPPVRAGVRGYRGDNPEEPTIGSIGRVTQPSHFRGGEYVHVSDLIGKCIRMIAIHRVTGLPIPAEPLSDFLALTFDVGNTIHDFVRKKIMQNSPQDIYGGWTCPCGTEQQVGTYEDVRNKVCRRCGLPMDRYQEMVIRNDEFKIIGSVDLTLIYDNIFYLTEIKSIKHDVWETMTGPLPEHMLQIVMYWELARLANWPIYDTVSVLYVTKGFQFTGTPYKEFKLVPANYLTRIEPLFEDALALTQATDPDTLPANIECPARNAPKARKCAMVTPCFEFDRDA